MRLLEEAAMLQDSGDIVSTTRPQRERKCLGHASQCDSRSSSDRWTPRPETATGQQQPARLHAPVSPAHMAIPWFMPLSSVKAGTPPGFVSHRIPSMWHRLAYSRCSIIVRRMNAWAFSLCVQHLPDDRFLQVCCWPHGVSPGRLRQSPPQGPPLSVLLPTPTQSSQ